MNGWMNALEVSKNHKGKKNKNSFLGNANDLLSRYLDRSFFLKKKIILTNKKVRKEEGAGGLLFSSVVKSGYACNLGHRSVHSWARVCTNVCVHGCGQGNALQIMNPLWTKL